MKLYVRIKRPDGKWTFRAACPNYIHTRGHVVDCECNLTSITSISGVKQE